MCLLILCQVFYILILIFYLFSPIFSIILRIMEMLKMSFTYKPLFKLLIDRSLKKTDLIEKVGISAMTLAKFAKNEYVSMPD